MDISNSEIGAPLLIPLKSLPLLRKLILEDCECNNADLVHVKDLLSLEKLSLNGSAVNDEGLFHWGGHRGLRILGVESRQITDAGVAQLTDMPCLVELELGAGHRSQT